MNVVVITTKITLPANKYTLIINWYHITNHRCIMGERAMFKIWLIPTSRGDRIHINLVAIWLKPTIHFDRQSASSLLWQTFTHSSSTCFFQLPFSLPFFQWPSSLYYNALPNTQSMAKQQAWGHINIHVTYDDQLTNPWPCGEGDFVKAWVGLFGDWFCKRQSNTEKSEPRQ